MKTINAIDAAFTQMKFMPTGGVNAENVMEYLSCPRVCVIGGSWMVKSDLIKAGRFDEIEAMTRKVVEMVRD